MSDQLASVNDRARFSCPGTNTSKQTFCERTLATVDNNTLGNLSVFGFHSVGLAAGEAFILFPHRPYFLPQFPTNKMGSVAPFKIGFTGVRPVNLSTDLT
jgi:hypothetical protein